MTRAHLRPTCLSERRKWLDALDDFRNWLIREAAVSGLFLEVAWRGRRMIPSWLLGERALQKKLEPLGALLMGRDGAFIAVRTSSRGDSSPYRRAAMM